MSGGGAFGHHDGLLLLICHLCQNDVSPLAHVHFLVNIMSCVCVWLRYVNPYVWCAGMGVLSAQTLLDHCHRSPLPCACYVLACFPAYLRYACKCWH